jgi:hypothetical protein
MPETPEQLHGRAATALRTPSVHAWDTWPFEGDIRPKELEPLTPEPVIAGQGGEDCRPRRPRSGRTTSTASSKR